MANNYYSSYYQLAPSRGSAAYIPRSASVDHQASDIADIFTVPVTASLGVGDTFTLLPAIPAGFKVTRLTFIPSTALDTNGAPTLAVNIGFTSNATAIASAVAALRNNTTAVSVTDTQLLQQTAAVAGDNLLVTVQAAPATPVPAGGTIMFLLEGIYP
jgi:hypothetical protein